ncbi:alanine--glyoxylate aminotransferase family protein [Sebaldella sp. S0638]|uniref:pyridoxal-phosphate-dependent aminotransferase family protein n=1 Tax=Sebaldella sp. S0638 TaxID=2957809 RepID=UPI00209FE814|nr:alanine--glyoxylate aminotransferase family protein [Sebaldella sp. S0638]MCP1224797.1 alanine--glyoxylate aminotransferase family protein [Sebaldella sp. S0638]
MKKKVLLTPGPTNIPENLLGVLGTDIVHHRKVDFHNVMKELNENLKKIFQTKENVYVLTSSGTGAMEAAVVNYFSKGEKVLVINTGYFGDRFRKIAGIYGLEPINLEYEFGESYKLEDVKKALAENPDIKGIFITHSETSTGVLNNVKAVGELTKNTDILLVVDTISGLVANDFDFDGWNVDVAVAGSQKAFLIPPGLAFIAMSQKARKAVEKSDIPKYYFDIKQAEKALESKNETPFTPAIGLIIAANVSCRIIAEKGVGNIVKEKYELRKYIEEKLSELDFKILVKDEENRSNTLISVVKDGIKIKNVIRSLEERGYTVTGGKGDFEDSLMRVGILGEFSKEDIDKFLVVLTEELAKQ